MRGASGSVIAGHELYVYAFDPVPGLPTGIVPAITAGRAPAAADEIALGSQTMSDAGVDLGDTVALSYLDQTHELRVVGQVIINDNYEVDPGRGGVVTSEWMTAADPSAYASDFVLRFQDGHGDGGLAELKERFPGLVDAPLVQDDVVNLRRLDSWPAVLAGFAILDGRGGVRARPRDVGPCAAQAAGRGQGVGLVRGQVGGSIFWYASFLALPGDPDRPARRRGARAVGMGRGGTEPGCAVRAGRAAAGAGAGGGRGASSPPTPWRCGRAGGPRTSAPVTPSG